MIHWNAGVLMPYLFSLVIVLVNRDIKSVLWQFEHLCNILPSPCNGFLLEVIAEGEVTKHFKICAMSCRLTNVFNIACSDTLLTSCHSCSRRCFLTCEVRLQRRHTCNDKQQAVIVLRYERVALVS